MDIIQILALAHREQSNAALGFKSDALIASEQRAAAQAPAEPVDSDELDLSDEDWERI